MFDTGWNRVHQPGSLWNYASVGGKFCVRCARRLDERRPSIGLCVGCGGAIEHGSASVTSYVNALGLSERYYAPAVHWFHSTAFCIDGLCEQWSRWRQGHPQCVRWRDQRVYIGMASK